jgi:hypothetical protein
MTKKAPPPEAGTPNVTGKGASPFPKNQARLTFLVSVFGLSPVSEAFT